MVHRNRNVTLQVSQSIHPQDKIRTNIRHSRPPPSKFHMPQMSSMVATYHDAKYLIYELQNPEPAITFVKLGNSNKEEFKTLADIFIKVNPPAVPPRVPVREVGQKKLQ